MNSRYFAMMMMIVGLLTVAAALTMGCEAERTDTDRPVGDECTESAQCSSGVCMENLGELEFPNGLCTEACGEYGSDCDNGSGVCLTHSETGVSACYERCDQLAFETGEGCRSGYECYRFNFLNHYYVCLPEGLE